MGEVRRTPPPTLREGWVMPDPPHPSCKPFVHFVGPGDGFSLYWATQEQADGGDYWSKEGSCDPVEIDWPFGDEDFANVDDFVALGFTEND